MMIEVAAQQLIEYPFRRPYMVPINLDKNVLVKIADNIIIDWKHICYDSNSATNFTAQLLRLISKSDTYNKHKLANEYPEHVFTVYGYTQGYFSPDIITGKK